MLGELPGAVAAVACGNGLAGVHGFNDPVERPGGYGTDERCHDDAALVDDEGFGYAAYAVVDGGAPGRIL